MAKNDHTFFSNPDCKYFTCHKVKDKSQFNCLFCFCPLFWLKDCGGTPDCNGNVKDCSNCIKPHSPGGYEHVLNRLKKEFEKHNKS